MQRVARVRQRQLSYLYYLLLLITYYCFKSFIVINCVRIGVSNKQGSKVISGLVFCSLYTIVWTNKRDGIDWYRWWWWWWWWSYSYTGGTTHTHDRRETTTVFGVSETTENGLSPACQCIHIMLCMVCQCIHCVTLWFIVFRSA